MTRIERKSLLDFLNLIAIDFYESKFDFQREMF